MVIGEAFVASVEQTLSTKTFIGMTTSYKLLKNTFESRFFTCQKRVKSLLAVLPRGGTTGVCSQF
jgi:hypothetical protein